MVPEVWWISGVDSLSLVFKRHLDKKHEVRYHVYFYLNLCMYDKNASL